MLGLLTSNIIHHIFVYAHDCLGVWVGVRAHLPPMWYFGTPRVRDSTNSVVYMFTNSTLFVYTCPGVISPIPGSPTPLPAQFINSPIPTPTHTANAHRQ